ncbi:RNA polymerase sigma factor [Pseudomonas sp. GX19020]|uniref:RNA polymerase sigma factor n=1 Tax=Pseudomonas sp. GX19020 TaxID=2942277 RepID=UPI002018A756|nr:RNA polymerase sigma factor [Pseudomonas sp. GX19020]MCL4069402.1 RNA polymerase sigma factor [Pseudomonas sp. GX19020]
MRYAERPYADEGVVRQNRSYLFRTAHNLAVDHVREQRRKPAERMDADDIARVADNQPGQEQVAAGRERMRLLLEILGKLPERTRQVFVLNRIEGLSYAEVARSLRISESSVQKHLAKGLLHVTSSLREREKNQ